MVNRDFSDLFAAFNEARVRYLLVGAHAVAFYAEPRYTKDVKQATGRPQDLLDPELLSRHRP